MRRRTVKADSSTDQRLAGAVVDMLEAAARRIPGFEQLPDEPMSKLQVRIEQALAEVLPPPEHPPKREYDRARMCYGSGLSGEVVGSRLP